MLKRDPIRVTTFTRFGRMVRRCMSRNEWAVWLLGLSRTNQSPTQAGLIMIQIDGLSQTELNRALEAGQMPFIQSLLQKELYRQHTLYSGLPSSTPSVQGELYYGQRGIVPAFGFRDHRTGRLVRMFAQDIATETEQRLKAQGSGLLQGGSSYANVFSGGADDVYFCATSFGRSEVLQAVNPWKILVVLLLNFLMFTRVVSLMVSECFWASLDFVRGIASGREFWQELIMIPARVIVVVLLRELVTISACFDAARGQPIVHLNMLGYDEQAHRRGPRSKFAHWALKGIDNSIRRVWNAAHRGAGREYDVWIFSDHGQEATRPYSLIHGQLIQQVVAEMVDDCCPKVDTTIERTKARLPSRASWLGVGRLVSVLFGEQDYDIQTRSPLVQTVTSGPLGFVYLQTDQARGRRRAFAQDLVQRFHVPMTAVADEACGGLPGATIYTTEGTFHLPEDAIQVFGPQHPFIEDVNDDLIRLVHHVDAGDIVMIGWSPNGGFGPELAHSISFVLQHGAHAGPGIDECGGFALLPPDIAIGRPGKRYLRPDDLRRAALQFLGREKQLARSLSIPVASNRQPVRLLTYNVHACVGMDGLLSPERVARVIAQSGANIVCLQELDVFRYRSGLRDQAQAIALHLEMQYQFHPAWRMQEERFGNAILTRFPIKTIAGKGLHHHKADRSRRSAIWAELHLGDGQSLQIINTHLSIYPQEQWIQAKQLIEEWVQPATLLGPVVLCGDFNALPNSKTCRVLSSQMTSVDSLAGQRARSTFFSPYPLTRVDHIFVTRQLSAAQVQVIDTRLAKVASDHLPLSADLRIRN